MDLERIEKKLREARFFFGKMINQESRAFGDKEPFDFYLSAFLSAGRTVDYRLRHDQATTYPDCEWSASSDQKIIIPWRLIDGPESADAVADEIMSGPVCRGAPAAALAAGLLF